MCKSCVMKARPADFDMAALSPALDAKRRALGLSRAGATHQINWPDAAPVLHPISVSSVTGTGQGPRRGRQHRAADAGLARPDTRELRARPPRAHDATQLPEAPPDRRLRRPTSSRPVANVLTYVASDSLPYPTSPPSSTP